MTAIYFFAAVGVLCVGAAIGIAALIVLNANELEEADERDPS